MLLGHRVSQKSILWPLVVVMLPGWLVLVSLTRRPAADWHLQMAFRERVAQQMLACDQAEQNGDAASLPRRRHEVASLLRQWHEAGLANDAQLVDEAVVWLRFDERDPASQALAAVKEPKKASPYFNAVQKALLHQTLEPQEEQKLDALEKAWPGDWWVATVARLGGEDTAGNAPSGRLAWWRLRIADSLPDALGLIALLLAFPALKVLNGTWKVWPYCERVQRLWPVPLMLCVLSLRGLFLLLGGTLARMVVPLISTAGQHDFLTVYQLSACLGFAFNMLVVVATTYGVKECVAAGWGTLGDVLGFEPADFADRRLWLAAFPCAVALVFCLEPLPRMLDGWHLGGSSLYDALSRSPGGYGALGTLLSVAQVVVIAPFVEEIIYRGFLLSTLRNALGTVPAVLFSSLIFALAHGSSVTGMVTAFLYGAAYASLKLHTGRLGAAMLMHSSVAAIITALTLLRGG